MKIALVTGASSGIGRDMSQVLSKLGYRVILVARNRQKLEDVKNKIREGEIYIADLSKKEECIRLHEYVKKQYGCIDILVNNAGFGLFGEFDKTELQTEIDMISTNSIAMHILTKLFLKDMIEKDRGHILNVASIAGLMPAGPLMSTYYATKNYIVSLSMSIQTELKKRKSKVNISILCPGPVDTNFNNVAKVKFNLKERNSMEIAEYAIKNMLKGKQIIVPGFSIKLARIGAKMFPDKLVARINYHMQERKR